MIHGSFMLEKLVKVNKMEKAMLKKLTKMVNAMGRFTSYKFPMNRSIF